MQISHDAFSKKGLTAKTQMCESCFCFGVLIDWFCDLCKRRGKVSRFVYSKWAGWPRWELCGEVAN
jgi:hypothetical protein